MLSTVGGCCTGKLISFTPQQLHSDKKEDNTTKFQYFWEEISLQEAEEGEVGQSHGKLSPNWPRALFHAPHCPWLR